MRKLLLLSGVLIFAVVNTFSQTTVPKGEIETTTWTKEGSPYKLERKVIIPKQHTLTIEAGVEIQFERIVVEGSLIANGSKINPINFIVSKNTYGENISFVESNNSKLKYCIIENADIALLIKGCNPVIEKSIIKNCTNSGLRCINASPLINNTRILNCKRAVNCDKGSAPVIKNSLIGNSKYGLDCYNSSPILENCNIVFNKIGISIGKNSQPQIISSILWGNKYLFGGYQRIYIANSIIQHTNSKENISYKDIEILKETNIIGIPISSPNFSANILKDNSIYVSVNHNSAKKNIGMNAPEINNTQVKNIAQNTSKEISVADNVQTNNNSISDVDINIPKNNNVNDYRFALIIGNEDYTKYQTNLASEVNVDFAVNDAEVFAKYCKNTLGVPEDNVFLLKNAIGTEMKREINKLAKMMMYTQGKAEVIFYYAGHGIPQETTKEAYIMPVDVSAQNIEDGVKLSWLYNKLNEYDAKHVIVFLDACFTGGARNQGLLAARGVKIKPKENAVTGNCVAFTSSSDIQSSLPYKEEQHGMFTYHLLKKLQETKGNITLGELSDYLYENVALSSIKVNSKEQTPKTLVSPSLKDSWKKIRLNE